MEKEILSERDVLENYFYLIVTYVYKYYFTIRFFKNISELRLVNKIRFFKNKSELRQVNNIRYFLRTDLN